MTMFRYAAGQVKIWGSENGELVQTLEGPSEGIEWLDWHPKGNILLAGSEDFTVWMWNATSGACMQADIFLVPWKEASTHDET